MEYYTIQGSCLFSILLPLNFWIGDYSIWFKQHGKKRVVFLMNIIICVMGVGVTVCLIREKIDPYIPFVFMGGIVVAIIQNCLLSRKEKHIKEPYNELELLFKYINIVLGVFICVFPHFPIFYNFILNTSEKFVVIICYIIYFMWGSQKVILNGLDIYLNKYFNRRS